MKIRGFKDVNKILNSKLYKRCKELNGTWEYISYYKDHTKIVISNGKFTVYSTNNYYYTELGYGYQNAHINEGYIKYSKDLDKLLLDYVTLDSYDCVKNVKSTSFTVVGWSDVYKQYRDEEVYKKIR